MAKCPCLESKKPWLFTINIEPTKLRIVRCITVNTMKQCYYYLVFYFRDPLMGNAAFNLNSDFNVGKIINKEFQTIQTCFNYCL